MDNLDREFSNLEYYRTNNGPQMEEELTEQEKADYIIINSAGNEVLSLTDDSLLVDYLEDIDTFNTDEY